MRFRPFCLSVLLLALAPIPLCAQWSGRMDFKAGLGGQMGNKELDVGMLGHVLTQGDVSLRYQTDKFSWNTVVGGKWEPRSSDNSRLNIRLDQPDAMDLELVYKTVKTRPLEASVRSTVDWKPSGKASYSAWVSYKYKNDKARNVSNSLSGILNVADLDEEQAQKYHTNPREFVEGLRLSDLGSYLASCYYELPRMDEHALGTGGTAAWQLGAQSLLQGTFSLTTTSNQKYTVWSVYKTSEGSSGKVDPADALHRGEAWMYRITPSSNELDFKADIHLRQTVREDSVRFRWTPGVRVFCKHSLDHNSGATLVDIDDQGTYIWKDSLRLRENFDFLALNTAPFLAAEYRGKNFELQADYSAQFYFCRLNDDTHRQPLGLISVTPAGNAHFTWKITDVHKLGVTHGVGAVFPDYLQICWYDRTGGYADQLFRGNAELESTVHSRYGLVYELKYKHFRYRMNNTVTRTINEMEQTWTNEEIEGRLYKVFYWVNSADSWAFGTAHRFGWEGKWLKAGIGVEYNQSRRTAKSNGAVKDASDWRLTGDADADLGKGWSAGVRVKYQSRVATFFTRFNEYWELNTHIQKQFKNITLYFDGRDLLDYARKTIQESADQKEYWVDVVRNNRRLFLVGIQWAF